jgi:regulator of replication initiation timing
MTENLLLKLEEKMMVLLTEVEKLRSDVVILRQENSSLRSERESVEERLKGLVSLFDAVDPVAAFNPHMNAGVPVGKPVLVQG